MVDLFAGPGGLDVAARWMGLSVYGLEWDADACATRGAAQLNDSVHDVRKYGPRSVPGATILVGGPPCQTFTVAGTGSGRRALDRVLGFIERMGAGEDVRDEVAKLDDERTGLVLEPLRWVLEAHRDRRPFKTIVLEQVPAVEPVWAAMREVLEDKLNYHVDHGVLRTEEFGVPQTRRRAVLIASREGEYKLPKATHRPYRKGVLRSAGDSTRRPWETMGEALPHRADPFEVISNYGTGGNPKLRGRRTSDQPSATVTGKISRNRVLQGGAEGRFSPEEAGRLQTFPLDYPWRGGDIAQQIGNAVPPVFALHVLSAALGKQVDPEDARRAVDTSWSEVCRRASSGEPPIVANPLPEQRPLF